MASSALRMRRSSKALSRPRSWPRSGPTSKPSSRRRRTRAVQTSSEALVALPAGVDLHARPAADFVRTAMGFSSTLTVASGEREADAKSLLAILALGAKRGTTLRLTADGDDAAVALDALCGCIAGLTE